MMKFRMKLNALTGSIVLTAAMTVASASAAKTAAGPKNTAPTVKEVEIREIQGSSSRFLNQEVVVSGAVERVFGRHAFVLDGDGLFNDQILVITPGGWGSDLAKTAILAEGATSEEILELKDSDRLRVTGQVRKLKPVEIERQYKVDLDPQVAAEFEGSMLVVIAGENRISRLLKQKAESDMDSKAE